MEDDEDAKALNGIGDAKGLVFAAGELAFAQAWEVSLLEGRQFPDNHSQRSDHCVIITEYVVHCPLIHVPVERKIPVDARTRATQTRERAPHAGWAIVAEFEI